MRKFFLAARRRGGAARVGRPSDAAFTVQVYDDGVLQGGILVIPLGANSILFGGTTTHFSIANGSALSNNPGTQGGSNLGLSGTGGQVTTLFGATGGNHTLRIVVSQDGFTAPTGSPLTLSASGGGSIAMVNNNNNDPSSLGVSSAFQAFLDNTNTLFGQPGPGATPLQTASASLTTPGTAPLVYSPAVAANPNVPGGTPFALTSNLFFDVTLSPNSGQDSFNSSFSVTAVVPAPAGLVLALTGLPVLGIGGWIRRRRQTA